jgi:CDP-diacylglycerol--glycerol-3-phosphate 3-phosphatidyltransferase
MAPGRLTFPNVITLGRIAACPAVFSLVMTPSVPLRLAAFVLFLAAALSDLWDGYLARKHGLITDLGKFLDPLADKLLLIATFVPFYLLSHRVGPVGPLPFLGPLPLWVVLIIFGREVLITVFRSYAVRRGVVIPAGKSGKYKAFVQNLFIGGLLLWYPLQMLSIEGGWSGGAWTAWTYLHGGWILVMLSGALLLTVFSMGDYLWRFRALLGVRR